jgi:BASS family bile acid:Na+ symporter
MAAGVTIPLVSKGFELALQQPFGYSAPIPFIVGQLVPLLVVPVAIGMWVRHRAPDIAERHGPALRRLALVGTGVVFLFIILDNPVALGTTLLTTAPLATVFVVGSIAAGWICGALVTEDRRDRFTLAAEFGARNVSVAMAIAVTILGRVEFARFAVTYALVEIPLMLAAVALFRRRESAPVLQRGV